MIKTRDFLNFLIIVISGLALVPSDLYAQNVKAAAKDLYSEGLSLTEIDSYGRSKEKHELGIRKLENAIGIAPSYYEAYVALSKAYWDYGLVYADSLPKNNKDDYLNKARQIAKKALELEPKRTEAYLQYWNMIEYGTVESRKIMQKLFELDSKNPDVMYYHGLDLIDSGKVKEGTEIALKGADGIPGEGSAGQAKKRLSEKLEEKGYTKEAQEIVGRLEQDDKFYKAVAEIIHGNPNKGMKMVNEVLNGDINKLTIEQKEYYAKTIEDKGKYKEAAEIYESVNREKYKEHIKVLREKAKKQEAEKKGNE